MRRHYGRSLTCLLYGADGLVGESEALELELLHRLLPIVAGPVSALCVLHHQQNRRFIRDQVEDGEHGVVGLVIRGPVLFWGCGDACRPGMTLLSVEYV